MLITCQFGEVTVSSYSNINLAVAVKVFCSYKSSNQLTLSKGDYFRYSGVNLVQSVERP